MFTIPTNARALFRKVALGEFRRRGIQLLMGKWRMPRPVAEDAAKWYAEIRPLPKTLPAHEYEVITGLLDANGKPQAVTKIFERYDCTQEAAKNFVNKIESQHADQKKKKEHKDMFRNFKPVKE